MSTLECSQCYGVITGRVVHDQDVPWCAPCRQAVIEHRASVRADRLIRRDVALARQLADLQDRPTQKKAA